MEEDESPYPMPVCFLSSEAIVLQANGGTNLIDEFWRTQGGHLGMCVSLSRTVERSIVDIVNRAVYVNLNRCTNGGKIHTAFSRMISCSAAVACIGCADRETAWVKAFV